MRAPSSLAFNLRAGWRTKGWDFAVDVLNLFDRENHDIAYFYGSRLPGEPAEGVDGLGMLAAEVRGRELVGIGGLRGGFLRHHRRQPARGCEHARRRKPQGNEDPHRVPSPRAWLAGMLASRWT